MTKVYFLSLDTFEWSNKDNFLMSFVSDDRKKKIYQCYFDIDKKLALYSVLLLKMQVNKLTKIPIDNLEVSVTSKGKPFFVQIPFIHFSFSHTKNAILCGISLYSPIGVDIEKIIFEAPLEVMNLVFHSNEQHYIIDTHTNVNLKFYEVWTRKEAYLKCLGKGLTGVIKEIDTFNNILDDNFYSWVEEVYMCTVYSCKLMPVQIEYVTEQDIYTFYSSFF